MAATTPADATTAVDTSPAAEDCDDDAAALGRDDVEGASEAAKFCGVLGRATKATVTTNGQVDEELACAALANIVNAETCPALLKALMTRVQTEGTLPSAFATHHCYSVAVGKKIRAVCDVTMGQIHATDGGGGGEGGGGGGGVDGVAPPQTSSTQVIDGDAGYAY